MKVLIVGCGRLGADLAYRMYRRGHDVSVIDLSPAAFTLLPSDFQGRLNEGDVMNQEILHRAGIEDADAVAVMTNSDTLNAVIGHLARTTFNVPNVIVRNYDPLSKPLIEAFDLQHVSATIWGAQRVEELICHAEVRTLLSAGNGEIEIYEFTIPEEWQGRALKDLINPANARAVSLTRVGKAELPGDDMVFEEGDVLLISATFEGAEEVRNRLSLEAREG